MLITKSDYETNNMTVPDLTEFMADTKSGCGNATNL